MKPLLLYLGVLNLCLCYINCVVNRPRGVSISMATFYAYNPSEPVFHCLDKSYKIPYEYINDDYCDCGDGSDEPGTSACPNGKYHCTNAGHIPYNILSSRVNDGICDCCDGTDEYENIISCSNTCKELGRLAREEAEREKLLVEDGNKIRISYSEQGKKAVTETTSKVVELEKELAAANEIKSAAEEKKTAAEEPEKTAKEYYDKLRQEEKDKREKEADVTKCAQAFDEIDVNKDGQIDVSEMMLRDEFDIDNNGVVSNEEATEYMSDVQHATLEHFTEKMWSGIKDIYKPKTLTTSPPSTDDTAQPTPPTDGVELPSASDGQEKLPPASPAEDREDDEDDYRDDDEIDDHKNDEEANDRADSGEEDDYKTSDEDDAKAQDTDDSPHGGNDTDDEPPYDEETKLIIKAADEARSDFKKAEEEVNRIQQSLNDAQNFLSLDLGLTNEFYPLKDECYDLHDREYTYTLCPFGKASQKPKNGGSETSLGKWGKWFGPDNDKYSRMRYENGQGCWNGPDRSVTVELRCGVENQLISASEPSRCEYHFVFVTPARCTPQTTTKSHLHSPHTEL